MSVIDIPRPKLKPSNVSLTKMFRSTVLITLGRNGNPSPVIPTIEIEVGTHHVEFECTGYDTLDCAIVTWPWGERTIVQCDPTIFVAVLVTVCLSLGSWDL